MAQSPMGPRLILGVTRKADHARGDLSGMIVRDGDRLKYVDLAAIEQSVAEPAYFKLEPATGGLAQRILVRVEYTVNGKARCLFRQNDGTLRHDDLYDKLQFSEGKKALLKPQALTLPPDSATVEYLEVSRLSDTMRKDMLMGERTVGQLCEVLGSEQPAATLETTLWTLARQGWLTIFESGQLSTNALSLPKPLPPFKR